MSRQETSISVKNEEDVRSAADFVLRLGHAIARRLGIAYKRIRYFDGAHYRLDNEEEGWTLSQEDSLSRRKLHASPTGIFQRREDGRFVVGIAVLVRRFEFTWVPSCIGILFKLHRSAEGRFIVEEPIGRFSQGRKIDPSLYGRIFNWNEANITEFVVSLRE